MEQANTISKNLDKLESNIQDLIMLEDTARGTMCAIHNALKSTEDFPCAQHHIVHVCPSKPSSGCTRIPIQSKTRKRDRSKSPCGRVLKLERGVVRKGCKCLDLPQPQQISTRYTNVEKTTSCPGSICCCNLPVSSNRSCSVKSRSTVEFCCSKLNASDANLVVNELKGELQKMQSHLQHIASIKINPNESILNSNKDDPLLKLKDENKQLKRELDNKKKLLDASKKDVETAKSILSDYEKKVNLLHTQALKSSKIMNESKEKFCKCLRNKEIKIEKLSEYNDELLSSIKEKEQKVEELNQKCECLKSTLDDISRQSNILSESNHNYNKCIKTLESQLRNAVNQCGEYKEGTISLGKRVRELNCRCKKLSGTSKKQKEILEDKLKKHEEMEQELKNQLTFLSQKLSEKHAENNSLIEFKRNYNDVKEKLEDYEQCSSRCKILEEQCKEQLETALENEKCFQKERDEMQTLISDLTDVVRQNKATLLQISEVNKQQEFLIQTQSAALMTKDDQIKLIEKESDTLRRRSEHLEKEVEELRNVLEGPCTKEACLNRSRQLEEISSALTIEKDNRVIKEKIIEDQSQTICALQIKIKDKICELEQAQNDTESLKKEIYSINSELERKHEELSREIYEKGSLVDKLRVLEEQKNSLSEELGQLEIMLRKYINTCKNNGKEQRALDKIQLQVQQQKQEWEAQKEYLAREKETASKAAKFATQKLLETVADFQKQVDTQKKVQIMLTKMLHEKDEQLKAVTEKMSSISQLTQEISEEIPMRELYRCKGFDFSNATTSSSFYSACSNCRRNNYQKTEIQELFKLISDGNLNEVPSRDK